MEKNFSVLMTVLLVLSCERPELIAPAGFEVTIPADTIVFAQIGDYGSAGIHEELVADLVKSWNPDFIVSVGDNNYTDGEFSTLRKNISEYYGDYIYNFDAPQTLKCNGRAFQDGINRFFPTPGNHDNYSQDKLVPYYNFFTLPGNECYYKFVWGPVTFYSINSVTGDLNAQKDWLEKQVALSLSPFNIVFFHHPPYSSGAHGNDERMQWDFYALGVDMTFSGHDHVYNRIEKIGEENMYYIVNGLGGKAADACVTPFPSDEFNSLCFGHDFGAVKAIATNDKLTVAFYSLSSPSQPVDSITIIR